MQNYPNFWGESLWPAGYQEESKWSSGSSLSHAPGFKHIGPECLVKSASYWHILILSSFVGSWWTIKQVRLTRIFDLEWSSVHLLTLNIWRQLCSVLDICGLEWRLLCPGGTIFKLFVSHMSLVKPETVA
jgi:hypothetical protein